MRFVRHATRLPTAFAAALLAAGCANMPGGGAGGAPDRVPGAALTVRALTVAPSDAGDEAFVHRLLPVLWGRRAVSRREVDVLVQLARAAGREALVRAMGRSPEYRRRWEVFLKDHLGDERLGFDSNADCYGRASQPEVTPDLAAYVRDTPPFGPPYDSLWTMKDLFASALALDDVSPALRAHLGARLFRTLDDREIVAAVAQRRKRAEVFMGHYLHRSMLCGGCHNSEWSTTDAVDPAEDRFWQVPGLFEKALFGQSGGRDVAELNRFFRRKGVVAGYFYTYDDKDDEAAAEFAKGAAPWGWDPACGRFVAADAVPEDDDPDSEGYFIAPADRKATIWELETRLRKGFEKLRADGLDRAADPTDLTVDGEEAFAYLTAMSLVEGVWSAVFGRPLTAAHYFPRNAAQRDLLWDLTEVFVAGGFSLLDVLVAVVTHPYFNGALPEREEDANAYAPVFDPFVDLSVPVAARRNGLGDTVRRAPPRVLLGSAYAALGWPAPPEYMMYFLSPNAVLQRSVGVYLKDADPGFSGISFESALSWESLFGACADRTLDATCPLVPILSNAGEEGAPATVCELCQNAEYACDWDARCCDVPWDEYCDPEGCDTGDPKLINLPTWPRPPPPGDGDWIRRLLDYAAGSGTPFTLEDGVRALKDRILADPDLSDPSERAAIEGLLGRPLSDPLAGDADPALRRVCGLFLSTPQFMLLGLPPEPARGPDPALLLPESGFRATCERLGEQLFGAGAVTCTDETATLVQR